MVNGCEAEARGVSGQSAKVSAAEREGARGHGDKGTRGGNEDTRTGGLEGRRALAPGFRRLKAERLTPERLTTVAVTRHLSIGY
jgi:hypothetical protein